MASARRQRLERELADRRRRLSNSLTPLDLLVREQIAAHGPMPYADVVELALYHPEHGFYTSLGGQAGRRGDFITSPEVGPLFGHVVANALDAEWDRLGQPDVFTVVDYGAGPGTLARTVAAAEPRCWGNLTYIAVERSVEQRAQHPDWVVSTAELTSDNIEGLPGVTGVVIANELLDNLAFTPMQRVGDNAAAAQVVLADEKLSLVFVNDLDPHRYQIVHKNWVDQTAAGEWMHDMLTRVLAKGRLIVIDYARLSGEQVEIRTYAEHGRAGDPLEALGTKDITVDVDLEQLQTRVGDGEQIQTQAEWLATHGISALVEEGRLIWEKSAAVGDLAALKARSRIREAEALNEPDGLGGFLVAEWVVG